MNHRTNRRNFIKRSATLGLAALANGITSPTRAESPNEKLDLAFVGVGNRGYWNLNSLKHHNVVALCDVDGRTAKKAFEEHSDAPKFVDYRQMLDKMENQIDGVVISTPDHTHFHPAYQALQLGKNVYLEKPLAHSLWEIRTLRDLARSKGAATQLGVQRHTLENVRRSVELIQHGEIGKVTEVYCWVSGDRGMPAVPTTKPPVPDHLDWNLWLGPAKESDYSSKIAPYGWRFWWDYGTGETGNWGCHILDIPYWALGLQYPKRVSASGPKIDLLRTPKQMQSTLEFDESNSHGPVTLHWDHVKEGPAVLREHNLPDKSYNTLFIGTQGMLLTGFEQHRLIRGEEVVHTNLKVAETAGTYQSFYQEWITACKGGPAASCNFEYSAPLSETVLLSNLAYRSQTTFDWDHKTLSASTSEAQAMVRPQFRRGWEIEVSS